MQYALCLLYIGQAIPVGVNDYGYGALWRFESSFEHHPVRINKLGSL